MAVTRLTPITGRIGEFKVAAPFEVEPKVWYKVTAVRRFSEILGRGDDLFKDLYEPLKLSREVFDEHLKANACLVTLESEYSEPIRVPDTYILSIPTGDGYKYRRLILGVDLKALPSTVDVSYLVEILKGAGSEIIGVEPEVSIMEIPLDDTVSEEQHEINESMRKAKITSRETFYAENVALKQQVADLLATQAKLLAMLPP